MRACSLRRQGGIDTYVAPGDHRMKTTRLRLVSEGAGFSAVRQPEALRAK
jgi:hypothetical protein